MKDFEWYKSEGCGKCPFCASEEISVVPNSYDSEGLVCWNTVICEDCEMEWNELFEMSDIAKSITCR